MKILDDIPMIAKNLNSASSKKQQEKKEPTKPKVASVTIVTDESIGQSLVTIMGAQAIAGCPQAIKIAVKKPQDSDKRSKGSDNAHKGSDVPVGTGPQLETKRKHTNVNRTTMV